ncbi:MAG: tetratricopeptide repeat protein [Ignavibacteriales bacterium]|nr:tetratricopeptide repeat protein [Ignavibacteriales bacterium]
MRIILLATVFSVTIIGCSKTTDEELMGKAVEEHKSDNVEAALEAYQELIDEFPESPRVPEAMYARAILYHDKQRNSRNSVEQLKVLVAKFPDHATCSNALFLTGFIYNNELKVYDSAKVAYEEFLRRFPTSPLVGDARFELENLGKDPAEIIKEKIEKTAPQASKSGATAKKK